MSRSGGRKTVMVGVKTEQDFKKKWKELSNNGTKVDSLIIFSHGGKEDGKGVLYFSEKRKMDGTVSNSDLKNLPKLQYNKGGNIDVRACLGGSGNNSVAETLSDTQNVSSTGVSGKATFSTNPKQHNRISFFGRSKKVYLDAFNRSHNNSSGDGKKLAPQSFSPND